MRLATSLLALNFCRKIQRAIIEDVFARIRPLTILNVFIFFNEFNSSKILSTQFAASYIKAQSKSINSNGAISALREVN